jgi:hypothetical protein
MNQSIDLQAGAIPTDWQLQGGDARKTVWVRILASLAASRERSAAAVLYAELSKLSNPELERRGFGRGDLHWQVSQSLRQP